MGTNPPHTPPTLSIIGAGHVGQSLARLWQDAGIFEITGIVNRSLASAQHAAAFIGAGFAVTDINELPASDLYMIAVRDDHITAAATTLAQAKPQDGAVVFHCSGALCSAALLPLDEAGLKTASLHPLNSFTDPAEDTKYFAGTYCALEGHPDAVDLLSPAIKNIGGLPLAIEADKKRLYHAGAVFACNYLSALMDASLQCYEGAGIERETAIKMIAPLVETTWKKIKENGPAQALTGPIARGDAALVQKQFQDILAHIPEKASLYRTLGLSACDLAVKNGKISEIKSQEINKALETPP